jgi:hypothetical protein
MGAWASSNRTVSNLLEKSKFCSDIGTCVDTKQFTIDTKNEKERPEPRDRIPPFPFTRGQN